MFYDANVFADYAFTFPIYRDIRYALKEITHLLGIRAILDRSNACFVTQTFASYAQTDASVYFTYTRVLRTTCVYAGPESWHELRGRSVSKFGNSIHSCAVRHGRIPKDEGKRKGDSCGGSAEYHYFLLGIFTPRHKRHGKTSCVLDETSITPLKVF